MFVGLVKNCVVFLQGEWYIPALEEFTDEELGIPPDDAPDPEYWGYQQSHTPIE